MDGVPKKPSLGSRQEELLFFILSETRVVLPRNWKYGSGDEDCLTRSCKWSPSKKREKRMVERLEDLGLLTLTPKRWVDPSYARDEYYISPTELAFEYFGLSGAIDAAYSLIRIHSRHSGTLMHVVREGLHTRISEGLSNVDRPTKSVLDLFEWDVSGWRVERYQELHGEALSKEEVYRMDRDRIFHNSSTRMEELVKNETKIAKYLWRLELPIEMGI